MKTMQGQTFEPEDSGAGIVSAHFLMSRFLTQTCNPYRQSSLESCFKREENAKKRKYEQRIIEVEHGSFTPLVFSTSGGIGNLASTFYKRLASLLSEKRREAYSSTLGWIRTHLSFSLLRSAIMCIRGARSSIKHMVKGCDSFDLVAAEAHIHESQ